MYRFVCDICDSKLSVESKSAYPGVQAVASRYQWVLTDEPTQCLCPWCSRNLSKTV